MKRSTALTLVLTTFLGVLGPTALWSAASQDASCPDSTVVQEKITATFPGREVIVKKIQPSPVADLCEIHVSVSDRNQILYTDSSGRYLVLGQIFDAQEKKNLTQARLEELNRLSAKDMEALTGLVAFSIGPDTASKAIYFVTDPQCPYCKQAETTLEAMASEGLVRVHYVLYPLPMHPGARESSIALICDKKGHDDFKKNYKSDNLCQEGTEKVDAVMKFMHAHGVSGTPTYIFPDGAYRSGVMDRSALESKLKGQ